MDNLRVITVTEEVTDYLVEKAFNLAMERDLKFPDRPFCEAIDALLDEAINFPPDSPEAFVVACNVQVMRLVFRIVFTVLVKQEDGTSKVAMTEEHYEKLKASGMMWEMHPEFTGDYRKDILGE